MGLPESIEGPHPTIFFSQLLVEVFGHQILPSPPELDRAHRIPASKPASGQRPRPVILRFHRYQVKDLVIRESRKKGVLTFQGHTIRIFEDYSPDVRKLRSEIKDAMAELYKHVLKPALLFPARLCITLPKGEKVWLLSASEANNFNSEFNQLNQLKVTWCFIGLLASPFLILCKVVTYCFSSL